MNKCACVFAYYSESSVCGPRHHLCLRGKQLLVEWREKRVSRERVTLTEPAELLHVQARQRTQHCHPLVQLQGGQRHIQMSTFYYSVRVDARPCRWKSDYDYFYAALTGQMTK